MLPSMRNIWLRFRTLCTRRELDRDLDDELSFHLAQRTEKNHAAGMDTTEARHAAQRQLGNASYVKERTREVHILTSIENAWRDVRFGTRMLLKEPGFTFIVILTLALGIGANTAIFSIINGFMLRPLPIADPHSMVYLAFPHDSSHFDHDFSYSELSDLRAQTSDLFTDVAGVIYGSFAGYADEADGLTFGGTPNRCKLASSPAISSGCSALRPRRAGSFFPAKENPPAPIQSW